MARVKRTRVKEPEKEHLAFSVIQEAARQLAQWKVAKIKDYGSRTGKCGSVLFQIVGAKTLRKEIQTRILGKAVNSIFGNILDLRTASTLEKSVSNFPVTVSVNLFRAAAMNAVKSIVKNTAKAGLVSALVDGLVASAEVAHLASKKKITMKKALNHLMKETSGGALAGMAGIGTVAMLTALSSIPIAGQIAILTSVNIGVKRFWNRLGQH